MPPADVILAGEGNPATLLDLAALFGEARAARPLEVEIGFGKGRFLVAAAGRWPDRNFLGVEYARALVRRVRDRVERQGLANVRLWHGEAKNLVTRMLPPASVSRLHVYYPDPWPKRRHASNRFFADPIPDALARALVPGGELLLVTDHDPYFREAVARLLDHGSFVRTTSEEPFCEIPSTGFGELFAAQGIPAFRGAWRTRLA